MQPELGLALLELKRHDVLQEVTRRAVAGEDPLGILDECRQGMSRVGERFRRGEYFLAELLLSAEIFKAAAAVLEPYLAGSGAVEPRGRVVLATLRGDIHDLGKSLVATLLRAHAFEVHDLGVDVEPGRLVAKVDAIRPDFVCFSALLTTAFPSMKQAADLLVDSGLRAGLVLMVGGGVTTPALAQYLGADFQTADAAEGVAYCVRVAGGR